MRPGYRPCAFAGAGHAPMVEYAQVEESNIPEPYDGYWKLRDYGEEAERADALRGDIHKDTA